MSSDLLPVLFELVVEDKVVEVLVLLGLLEWKDALDDDEEDDSSRKYVYLSSIILLSFFDFWSHVSHGTSVGLQLVDLFVSGESEVGNL